MSLGLFPLGLNPLGLALEPVGDSGVTGSATITEAADSAGGSAQVQVGSTATVSEAADSASAAATVQVQGSGAATEGGDTAAGAGGVPIAVSASITEAGDAASGAASVDSNEVLAAASITEAGDSASGAAAVPVAAAGTATEAGDTVTGSATPEADPRYARPASDVSAGTWSPSSGTSLAAMLDEPSADSADYISTDMPGTCEVRLNPVADPGTSAGQVVRYQVWSPFGNGMIVRLKQGATIIAAWNHVSLPTAPEVFAQPLSPSECDSITNYADLRFEFEAV